MAADAHGGGAWQRVGGGNKYKSEEGNWQKFSWDDPTEGNRGAYLKKK